MSKRCTSRSRCSLATTIYIPRGRRESGKRRGTLDSKYLWLFLGQRWPIVRTRYRILKGSWWGNWNHFSGSLFARWQRWRVSFQGCLRQTLWWGYPLVQCASRQRNECDWIGVLRVSCCRWNNGQYTLSYLPCSCSRQFPIGNQLVETLKK